MTQNVDGLHHAAGSHNVAEIHGSLFKTQCMACGDIADNRTSPICEALRSRGYVVAFKTLMPTIWKYCSGRYLTCVYHLRAREN